MRTGICCGGYCLRYGDNAYTKLRELGFDAVDFGLAETETEYYSLTQTESDALLLHHRELAKKAGVEIFQVHGPWRWPPMDDTEERRAERMDKMKRSIRMASILGAKNWVVHPIMPFGIEDIGTGKEEETWELNRVFMRELIKTAHEYDVTICLENMPMTKFSLATPEAILKFVKEMNDDHFMICLDTGHVNVFPDLSLGDEVRRLGSYIRCMHIHDNKYGRDMHLFPTFGNAEWKDFGKALADIGYDGVFSIEVNPPAGISDGLYEEMSRLLVSLAREIINYGGKRKE